MLAEVSPTGTITSSRNYDVYGNVRSGVNANGTSAHKFVGNLGHPSDNNTGLIYMQARYMDPATGTFASEDSKHDGNWFVYAGACPTNYCDRTGGSYQSIVTGIAIMLGLLAGYDLGYFLMAVLLEHLNPGYTASGNALVPMTFAFGLGCMGQALSLMSDAGDLVLGQMSLTAFAKAASAALSSGGAMKYLAGAAGIAFIVGLICGAAGAIVEYMCSDSFMFGKD